MGQKILITGAAGYLGSIMAGEFLRAGHSVVALDNLSYGQHSLFHYCADPNFEFVRGDARDKETIARLMKDADVLVPLACLVGAPGCKLDPWTATSVNRDAVVMLNKLRSKHQLVVFPTTNSGYGTTTGDVFCTEDTPLEPISLYGKTKVEAEADLLASENAITLRLATVFGTSPRMRLDLLVNHFTYAAVTDRYIVIFEKHFKRNYIHVRDVADAFVHCIANRDAMAGKPYNAGLDEANLSKEELALKIQSYVPEFYIHFGEIGSDPDKRNYVVSNKRLEEAGFKAKRGLDAGIQELIKGYRMVGRMPFKNV